MEFEKFLEKIVSVTEIPMDLEFKPAILWFRLDRLPVGVVSLGSGNNSVIRFPNRVIACEGNVVPVIALAYGLFTNRTDITDIILPNKLERISKDAFSGCSNLKRITIPKTVRIINERAFKDCDGLEDVYFDGTQEEWNSLKIIHESYRVKDPKQLGLYSDIETYVIPGNEALFRAKIHFNCVVPDDAIPHKLKRIAVDSVVYNYVIQ